MSVCFCANIDTSYYRSVYIKLHHTWSERERERESKVIEIVRRRKIELRENARKAFNVRFQVMTSRFLPSSNILSLDNFIDNFRASKTF